MKFEKTEVWGFEHALRGMRNPMESWAKSDSGRCMDVACCHCPKENSCNASYSFSIGKEDMALAQKLVKAGSEHRKFMRQIFVSVDITAPLYWWKEFDTYKVGTVTNSCSTMHTLADTPITLACFEMDDFEDVKCKGCTVSTKQFWEGYLIPYLERLRKYRNKNIELSKEKGITQQERVRLGIIAKRYWKELVRMLPESWLQKRTVTMDYENLLAMCSKGQRRFHKLTEWSKQFIGWARGLPYAQELLFLDEAEKQ